jgi:hypothetical protein
MRADAAGSAVDGRCVALLYGVSRPSGLAEPVSSRRLRPWRYGRLHACRTYSLGLFDFQANQQVGDFVNYAAQAQVVCTSSLSPNPNVQPYWAEGTGSYINSAQFSGKFVSVSQSDDIRGCGLRLQHPAGKGHVLRFQCVSVPVPGRRLR